jgi:hypothetical protein
MKCHNCGLPKETEDMKLCSDCGLSTCSSCRDPYQGQCPDCTYGEDTDYLGDFEEVEMKVSSSEAWLRELFRVPTNDITGGTFTCDFCMAETYHTSRWEHRVLRPSDPTELVAVLWLCEPCGESSGAHEYGYWVAMAESSGLTLG